MGATLSPFRYIQVARYLVNKAIDSLPIPIKGKGKAKLTHRSRATNYAIHHVERGLMRTSAALDEYESGNGIGTGGSSLNSSSSRSRTLEDSAPPSPIAGPSRLRDQRILQSADNQHHKEHPHSHPHQQYQKLSPDASLPSEPKEIYRLMNDHRLLVPSSVKPPRDTVVLCHGLYGFSTATPIPLFPSLKLHYWANVLEVLRDRMGVNVVVVGVKGTGSIKERAEQMHEYLKENLPKGAGVNFVAHSMGGLDCRHLISTIKPTSYTPLSLTSIGTPHRGSPFMDWCAANIGVGSAAAVATAALTAEKIKGLPYSLKSPLLALPAEAAKQKADGLGGFTSALTKYLLSIFDSPAYSNLTTSYLRDHFNPNTPDDPNVKYTSVAGRISKMSVLHPLWFPKLVLDAAEDNGYAMDANTDKLRQDDKGKRIYEGNDGLVSVSSAKWGEFLGVVDECHHWELRGEGGLFPTGASTGSVPAQAQAQKGDGTVDKKGEGKVEDMLSAMGMGMGQDMREGVNEYLGLGSGSGKENRPRGNGSNAQSTAELDSAKKDHKSSSWDIAQVGQVLDWVTDYLPYGKSSETGKRQLEEAQREKDKEIELVKEIQREKRKKEKFDLARFYGGLMLKLREDGF